MKLYGAPPTRAIRPLWVLNELDLDCEIISVDIPNGEHLQPHFLAINPFGKIPALVDGDLVIAESVAIMMYLAERYSAGRFIPEHVTLRAQMHQWMYYLVAEIEQPLWRSALHTVIYPAADRQPSELPLAERDCRRMLAPLEQHMAQRLFLVGEAVSVADFNAAYTLDWAQESGWLNECPNLSAFVARMYARPAAPPMIAEAFAAWRADRVPPRRRSDISDNGANQHVG
jgi:glutathione S-transferase